LTGGVPAQLGAVTALKTLRLNENLLTGVPGLGWVGDCVMG